MSNNNKKLGQNLIILSDVTAKNWTDVKKVVTLLFYLLFPVIIGDGAVGKTCFVKKLLEASCNSSGDIIEKTDIPDGDGDDDGAGENAAITDEGTAAIEKAEEYTPTIMDNYTFQYTRDGEQKNVR